MFELALKAGLPMIEATTDDLLNLPRVLEVLSGGKKVMGMSNAIASGRLYFTSDPKWDTAETYNRMLEIEATLVLVNMVDASPYAFRVGPIPIPATLLEKELVALVPNPELVADLLPGLRGLSLKTVREVLMLTEARHGFLTAAEVRRTRSMVAPSAQGLTLMDTTLDFYDAPSQLTEWLDLNTKYFNNPAHARLTPRGLLFNGQPGVGKSTAAKAIARAFGVPLYRLDIAATLDRYIGVSESRLAQSLALIDRESPCVLLIDEAEKIFGTKDGESAGVTSRMLSQLLWWLAEHQSRVFTVMTTNNLEHVPVELYRQGRIDKVIHLNTLNRDEAVDFGLHVLHAVIPSTPDQRNIVRDLIAGYYDNAVEGWDGFLSHAAAAEMVYTAIKTHGWGIDKPTNSTNT